LAREAGWSTGALYEYVARKEDVLYLVCDAIHGEMEAALRADLAEEGDHAATLEAAIGAYVRTCDRMQDSILLIYRETASLPEEARRHVLANEMRITKIFDGLLKAGAKAGVFRFKDARSRGLMAHNITVVGHMWAFRRWALGKQFTLKHYIKQQTSLLIREIMAT
jgi:AcrR family transcriptional regulator